jgi:zinc protease
VAWAGLLCLLLPSLALPKTKLVEKVTRKGTELVIPYEKYVLPNGLTLLVHEDHSDPVVHVDVTYHVGSAREEIGKSGFAHFFEHMMFQGSDHVGDEQHFKLVSAAGGTLNGTTNRDRTNYFETVPSNQLETALWLEADRMGFLLDAVTQKKFEVQRATVKNERGQNYDNQPYGLVYEYTSKNLYPYGHPYSWLTIGYLEDLDRSDVNDLKNFFLRWYGPNNAVVTVGGDVDAKTVVKLTEKYFGAIPKGPAVPNLKLPAVTLLKDRYVSYEDNIRFPMLRVVFPTVPQYHPDEAPLDLLAEILGGSNTSLLYQNLVKAQKAVQANAFHPSSELAGEFTLTALAFPDTPLDSMERIVRRSLTEFEKRGVTDDDIARIKASRETQIIQGLASVAGKASQLAAFQTFTGNPNYLPTELKRYQSVTKADVMRVYNKYIKGKGAVLLSVYPKGKPQLVAAQDNHTIAKEGYKAPDYGYAGLKYVKAKDYFRPEQAARRRPQPDRESTALLDRTTRQRHQGDRRQKRGNPQRDPAVHGARRAPPVGQRPLQGRHCRPDGQPDERRHRKVHVRGNDQRPRKAGQQHLRQRRRRQPDGQRAVADQKPRRHAGPARGADVPPQVGSGGL